WNGPSSGTTSFRPVYLEFSQTGFLYVSDGPGTRVLTFTKTGQLVKDYSLSGGCSGSPTNASGIAVQASGDFFVVQGFLDCVQKRSSSGVLLSHVGSTGTGPGQFRRPYDATLSLDGTLLYVVDNSNHRIEAFLQDAPIPVLPTTWSGIKIRF